MRTMPTRARWLLLAATALILAAAVLLAYAPPTARPAGAEGAPGSGTVIGSRLGVLYPATALTGSGTATSASPRIVGGVDLSLVRWYHRADLFVTADFATTGSLTATVQFSADGTNWANATYRYVDGDGAPALGTYQVVLTADGTGYVSVPAAGQYVRVSLERTASVTPTVNIHLVNDGGS